ncbi:alpha-ribazole phosphatase [Actibacterium mucosum KCTC 23349]|uniref:threonine-phosphate decarboxylase n=1 Tax=Actibacterium mucosum KCTC 23349 TaxID=1454373 RepID=A0A037ZI03_9RHOB|nr:threonine-phosphate decarboxylase CobD [Actibacterium mucosum]KAJ55187.1 alpha-ribazole phosphatase [Actibacterium mucosum KCTC 23349]
MRDHGGNLDTAIAEFGGAPGDWIDLSTGINPRPFPVPELSARAWTALPTKADLAALTETAARAFGTTAPMVPLAGAQAAIQLMPQLAMRGRARVLGPTYNEHAASLRQSGWRVETVETLSALEGADLAVVVNPNNPDGQRHTPTDLRNLARATGLLIIDESFAEPHPGLSVAPHLTKDTRGIVVLRSFGKFFGLAGLRLGFAIGGEANIAKLAEMAGPWPVSGAAVQIGLAAYADETWRGRTINRLASDAERLDGLAARAGWVVKGGTTLFRLYDTGDAVATQRQLAHHHIWSRVFPYSKGWMRLGLTDGDANWARLEKALT